jgi:hypothetical protein
MSDEKWWVTACGVCGDKFASLNLDSVRSWKRSHRCDKPSFLRKFLSRGGKYHD